MPFRIETHYKVPDARSVSRRGFFNSLGTKGGVSKVEIFDCYTADAKMNPKQMEKAARLLTNPLVEEHQIVASSKYQGSRGENFDYAIEISFLPGVTDNVGATARETIEDGLRIKFKPGENVYSSQIIFVKFGSTFIHPHLTSPVKGEEKKDSPPPVGGVRGGGISEDIKKIADSLYNPLIQKAIIKTSAQFKKDLGFPPNLPKVKLTATSKITKVDLNVGDEELIKLGKFGIVERADKSADYYYGKGNVVERADKSADYGKGNVVRPFMGQIKRRGPLSLSLEYLIKIRDYFNKLKRQPTDVEIETLAQTWSEHCKHTIFADPMDNLKQGLYKTYIQGATEAIRKQKRGRSSGTGKPRRPSSGDFCVSVFTDNAGGIVFDKDYIITHKVETHNTPSALDPFGGSITGIVGVNRDCLGFGLGAKPIINTYGFCLAPTCPDRSVGTGASGLASPNDKTKLYRDKELKNPMLSARRILDGVVAGINAGGNQSGIPTNSGFLYFDARYRGKPLVFAGSVGLIPRSIKNRPAWIKQTRPGDLIVMLGGRVGADGIHGATFASEGLDTHSPATAVQIGDPITQKKFSDAIVKEARDLGLYTAITDCGAGGLSSGVGEMAQPSGGCLVELDKVSLKYPGLAPWQIWISESQERMVLAVPPKKWKNFEKLMKQRSVEATVIGKFTRDKKCVVKFGKQTVLNLDMDFLHNGRPIKHQTTEAPRSVPIYGQPGLPMNRHATDLNNQILKLLARPNLASTAFLATQYDHEVQGGSVLKPLQGRGRINADATVTRPVLTSKKGVVLSCGYYPAYSEIDPYKMAAASLDTAIRNAVAAGADVDYLALLDNFCWCSPENPQRLWQLKEAARACFDYATAFGTPFISGKDSMYNDFKGYDKDGKPIKISIPPTLLISAVGVIPDVAKVVSLDAKLPGDLIYILGETNDELGGSEYMAMIDRVGNGFKPFPTMQVPSVDAERNYRLYKSLFNAIQRDLIASSISLHRGGFITAVFKMLAGGGWGGEINLTDLPGDWQKNYQALFSESQGRILVSIDAKKSDDFESIMADNIFARLGVVTKKDKMIITDRAGKNIVNLKISQAMKAYKETFKNY